MSTLPRVAMAGTRTIEKYKEYLEIFTSTNYLAIKRGIGA